jgi:hypothetical protein
MAADTSALRRGRWVVGENDFGGPMVEHIHVGGSAVAYVLVGANGREFARCTACGGQKSLAPGRYGCPTPAE